MQSFVVEQKRPRHCWRIDLIISSTQVRVFIVIIDRFKNSCLFHIYISCLLSSRLTVSGSLHPAGRSGAPHPSYSGAGWQVPLFDIWTARHESCC